VSTSLWMIPQVWSLLRHSLNCDSELHSLSCGSEWRVDTPIPGCGPVILVSDVSMRVVSHMDGLHLIRQSWVVASDVANLMLRIELWFVLELHPGLRMMVHNMLVPHVYLRVVACREGTNRFGLWQQMIS